MKPQPGALVAGWRLLWSAHRMLWWIYAVNLVIGLFSAMGMAMRLGGVLNHSLAAARLYHGFDVAAFIELVTNDKVQMGTRPASALALSFIFFVFMLFVSGGILETYARQRTLVPGEFFQGCGAFFWRFVRLLLWMLVVLAPVAIAAVAIINLSGHLSSDSPYEKLGFWVDVVGLGALGLLKLVIRLWFDLAQVRTVVEDEHGMTRALGRSLKLLLANFGALFTIFVVPILAALCLTALAFVFWVKLPAERIGLTLLAGQFVAWAWIAARLWQRASETIWYERQRPEPQPMEVEFHAAPAMARELTPPTPSPS